MQVLRMQLALCKLKFLTGIQPKIYLVAFVFKHTNTESVQLSISTTYLERMWTVWAGGS